VRAVCAARSCVSNSCETRSTTRYPERARAIATMPRKAMVRRARSPRGGTP
jgi:hypothetical protein